MKYARVKTNLGFFFLELNDEKAPATVENFLSYVHKRHYDGTIFHRVIDGFMVQGGGFLPGMKQRETDATIGNEAQNGLKNDTYTVAMARTNDPHSATAQFFINVKNNEFLNHSSATPQGWGYAVFGKVVEGQEVIDQIRRVKTGNKGFHQDVPVDDVMIISIEEWDRDNGTVLEQTAEPEAVVLSVEEIPRPGNDAVYYSKGFEIGTHEVVGAASTVKIFVGDDRGPDGSNHRYDLVGFQTGGNASESLGFDNPSLSILFQNGPVPANGANGITIESLYALICHRLEAFQDGPYACAENQAALEHTQKALEALKTRTANRVAKGVEGTNVNH
jgi:peptidyl-prolyl cis-trans isomerase B (cyclophilin B)